MFTNTPVVSSSVIQHPSQQQYQQQQALLSSSATKRLLRDWRDLERDPLPTVSARPLLTNIFTWHCNIFPDSESPYGTGVFHVILKFPFDYPSSPPQALLCTSVSHPNVFINHPDSKEGYPYICLDLLKKESSKENYLGWSTAYSVHSILMQLAAFLFDNTIPQYYGNTTNNVVSTETIALTIEKARKFECKEKECGHTIQNIQPHKLQCKKEEEKKEKEEAPNTKDKSISVKCYWNQINEPMTRYIFSFLSPSELRFSVSIVSSYFIYVIRSYRLLTADQIVCFHRRVTLADDKEIFGFGINREFHPSGNELKCLNPVLDMISYEPFNNNRVRMGVWKQEFTHWIPVPINQNHFNQSCEILEDAIEKMATPNVQNQNGII